MNLREVSQRLSTLGGWSKAAIIVAGYGAAFGAACLATSLYIAHENPSDVQGSPGMFAFGELLYFLFMFSICAAVPTALALYFLRRSERFWSGLSFGAVLLASTGLGALAFYFAALLLHAPQGSTLGMAAAFAVLRLLATPVLAGAFLLGLLLAPHPRVRTRFSSAMTMEAFCAAAFFARLIVGAHGF